MTHIFSFVIEGNPVPKQRPQKDRSGRLYTPQPTVDYEIKVRGVGLLKRPPTWKLSGTFKMGFRFYRLRDTGDLDNYVKCIKDGLKGVTYFDDRQVKGYFGDPEMFVDRSRPRAEITIKRVLA